MRLSSITGTHELFNSVKANWEMSLTSAESVKSVGTVQIHIKDNNQYLNQIYLRQFAIVESSLRSDAEVRWRKQILLVDYVAETYVNADLNYNPFAFDWIQNNDTSGGSALNLLGVFTEARDGRSAKIHFYNSLENQAPTKWLFDTTGYSTGVASMSQETVHIRFEGVYFSPRGRIFLLG